MADYIRDLRPAKWGSMINLRCKQSRTVLVRFDSAMSSRNLLHRYAEQCVPLDGREE